MFCLTVYALFNDRCRALAHKLRAQGHEVAVVVNDHTPEDVIDPTFPLTVCDWPAFDFAAIHTFKPDRLIVWNGKFTQIYAAVTALRRQYSVAIMELGWLPQRGFSYIAPELAQVSPIADIPFVPGAAEPYLGALDKLRAEMPQTDVPMLPPRFVYVPMQLEEDTQIVHTSDVFKSMHSLLGFVRRVVPANIPVVTSNHPCEPDVKRPDWVMDATKLGRSIDIARKANLVIGINSTLLAEAALFHKPVIALGRHVAHDAFLKVELADIQRVIDGDLPWDYKERCDYRMLTLLLNQWECANPPDWIVEQVVTDDIKPRQLPPPPPRSPLLPDQQTLVSLLGHPNPSEK
jgi:hypothetical protein